MENKGKSIIKYFLSALATTALIFLFVWAWCDIYHFETADPDIPRDVEFTAMQKDIYVDGALYNNWELELPFYIAGGKVYVPVDDNFSVILADACRQVNDFEPIYGTCGRHFEIDGAPLDLDDYVVMSNGQIYCAIRALRSLGYLDAEFTNTGFYISTDDGIKAEEYAKANPNIKYIEGRIAYMRYLNPSLPDSTALYYEYLFRHAASCTGSASSDLLLVMTRLESNFNADIGTRAIGLMQVLLKYAERKGYTYEDLCDPHINLHYGATYISDRLEYFHGDEVKSLSAYNLGLIPVLLTNNYSTAYAERVLSARGGMYSWLKKNNFGNEEFVEYIELD